MSNETLKSLSKVLDGEASEQELDAVLRAWNADAAVRRDWQALHMAGEALRSPELSAPAQSSQALLSALRQRIAAEPVVLRRASAVRWLPPLGVAAGFVLLAVLVPRLPMPGAGAPLATQAPSAQLGAALVTVPGSSTLDTSTSFVQTIDAPAQPGQLAGLQEQNPQRLLSAPPPFPSASAASAVIH
ncbi:MAG: sigma-E factor negative regulatory protein [Paucibacter sp.]|nr:sigma-E factor negative regulatory protein [Roseateles sp.]